MTNSNRLQEKWTALQRAQQEYQTEVRNTRIKEAGYGSESEYNRALREAEKKSLEESNRRFASVMGFGEEMTEARRILSLGRSGFDLNYNARKRGAVDFGGRGTLPAA